MGFSLMELFLDTNLTPLLILSLATSPCQPPSPAHSAVPLSRNHIAFTMLQVLYGHPTTPIASLPTSRIALIGSLIQRHLETIGVLPRSHTPLPHRVVRKHLGTMSWNPNAFASIVQAQPLLTFGRPVHLKDSSLNYDPVVLLMPFRLHLTMDALPCPITTGPSEALPPLLDIDPGPRVEWNFNPPETCAARHTLLSAPTPCHPSPQASLPSP